MCSTVESVLLCVVAAPCPGSATGTVHGCLCKTIQALSRAGRQYPLALQVLATATEEGNILLWQLPLQPAVPLNGSEPQELQPLAKLQGHAAKVFNVAWSPLLKVSFVSSMQAGPAYRTFCGLCQS